MGDRVSSIGLLLPCSGVLAPSLRLCSCSCKPSGVGTQAVFSCNWGSASFRNGGLVLISACLGPREAEANAIESTNSLKESRNSVPTRHGGFEPYGELGFKEIEKDQIEFETARDSKREKQRSNRENVTRADGRNDDATVSSGANFMEVDDESEVKGVGSLKNKDLARPEEEYDEVGSKLEELDEHIRASVTVRRGRRLMKRTNMLAKQVISMKSALSLGFVSQIWVDTVSWVVLVLEVRPNLLSGEVERFLLKDITQVGDVVLVENESVIENELKMVRLETLVGYNVVTPDRRSIGKVRGYTFDINSGALESLELDSFGMSIIPSSLVSTYALLVEDVLEVLSDTVVVHEAAASHVQRLTKGFWDSQKLGTSIEKLEDYSGIESQSGRFDYGRCRRTNSTRRNRPSKKRESLDDDWELPMDYL